MCLAIPGKIVNIDGDEAYVDYGGSMKTANISMVDAKVGQYVVVHAGFAIEVMDEEEANETLKLWNDFLDSDTAEIDKPN
ncbi:hydrogenase assembly protein HypC [Candidatus Methanomethylophilus sp. 1R26]|jgi:hydrogenase expression/formation protein HypC|uniref:HypC/HybG/HupF family hydrogenase formation chaperone n=1 Tax=Candidatus Methanomethylophilus sp. 1R26 TaxID=1769296 RepID=UPI0007372C75|nr:HypC/HybG/HupF family hydrogenase formation chaperone [Candidatus Methanomethylophilus sp. 1R26]MCH3978322.1 HypC/HybG/HupF family hydrogenase formation chaperone [Methanomethylophilus sp.]TQS83165.1 MAG: hydrogenase assembly protein HypC [Methanomethylophilus alvi]WII08864.1 HypC/HybG/HupF family hydrogenase formation chaperone [Methanomassiliicoccales archaeon LGM-DZ1]KUE73380.1 hydrogenase assembly protein HypC [Candidatus Methanomethylophilus sp. 1R26]MCI2075444.1 HypC/HybG/HupF family 